LGYMGRAFLLLALGLLLAGCRVDLYSDLSETEANEMMALLLKNNISCDKVAGEEKTWILQVDEAQTARALDILDAYGHPRQSFASMGELFKKEGLVSSPMEERVRFVYALSQELSHTISRIDGVLAARVHIVLPENNPFAEKIVPSSASVFIKHRLDSNVSTTIPQIKKLVVHSIEGLTYDKVTVVLFEAEEAATKSPPPPSSVLGIRVAPESRGRLWALMGLLAFLIVAASSGAGFFYWKLTRRREAIVREEPREQPVS